MSPREMEMAVLRQELERLEAWIRDLEQELERAKEHRDAMREYLEREEEK